MNKLSLTTLRRCGLIIFVLVAILSSLAGTASAQSITSMCSSFNMSGVTTFIGFPLVSGDIISVYVYGYSGSPTQAELNVNGSPVDTSSVPGYMSTTITSDGKYTIGVTADTGAVAGDWVCGLIDIPGGSNDGSKAGPPAMNLYDGRFNNHQGLDVAAPVAIYEGSIKVYGIDPASGDGQLAVDISEETVEAAGIPADAPVLLGQGKNPYTGIDIFVYRLTTGEFQINTHYADGKPYLFAWDADGGKWHLAA